MYAQNSIVFYNHAICTKTHIDIQIKYIMYPVYRWHLVQTFPQKNVRKTVDFCFWLLRLTVYRETVHCFSNASLSSALLSGGTPRAFDVHTLSMICFQHILWAPRSANDQPSLHKRKHWNDKANSLQKIERRTRVYVARNCIRYDRLGNSAKISCHSYV